jgi:hypothetical protein
MPREVIDRPQFPLATKEEIEALRRAYRKKPILLVIEEQLEHGIVEGKRWHNQELSNRELLRNNLGRIYRIWSYLIAHGDEDEQLAVWMACQSEEIRLTPRTDLLLAMIRLFLRVGGDRASRYGMALREAALRRVLPEMLAEHLGKKGSRINDLRDAYKRREANRQRPIKRPEASMGKADEKNKRSAVNKTGNEPQQDEKDDYPSVEWGSKALRILNEAHVGGKLQLVIIKAAADRVKILKPGKSGRASTARNVHDRKRVIRRPLKKTQGSFRRHSRMNSQSG